MANAPSKDLLFGAEEIAAELGVKVRRVYYWHAKKLLPITKVGRTLAASRSKLQKAIDKLTAA
jgi:hypothetical protein